jgi:hypothetical protein
MKPRIRTNATVPKAIPTIAGVFNLCGDTPWRWRGRVRGQIMVATAKGAETTYSLEVERDDKRSDYGCNCKASWNNIHPGGGERGQEVRSWS